MLWAGPRTEAIGLPHIVVVMVDVVSVVGVLGPLGESAVGRESSDTSVLTRLSPVVGVDGDTPDRYEWAVRESSDIEALPLFTVNGVPGVSLLAPRGTSSVAWLGVDGT